jgi:hypothetical protein
MTHTLGSSGARRPGPALPASGPTDQSAVGSVDFIRRTPDSDRLVVGAEADGERTRGLDTSRSPEALLLLLNALAETDPSPPEPPAAPPRTSLTILPAYQDPGSDPPAREPESRGPESRDSESGGPEFRQAPRNDPPEAVVRLRFADAVALERAGAAFGAGSGSALGDAWSDLATLTLQIPADAGTETLRAVLAVLDAAAITAVSLTVHTHELDDVFAAFTHLP